MQFEWWRLVSYTGCNHQTYFISIESAAMYEAALQRRLDAILLLLTLNALLLLGIGFRYARDTTVGVVVLALLLAYGQRRASP